MDTLPPVGRSSFGLPPINRLDPDRIKREDANHQQPQSTAVTPSPMYRFGGAPHPPQQSHSHGKHHSSTASAPAGSLAGLLSPSDSQRTANDEADLQRPTAQQSLPSIHEALGAESPLPYPTPVLPPSVLPPAPQHYLPPSATTSPSDQRTHPRASEYRAAQSPVTPFTRPRSPGLDSSLSQGPAPPHSFPKAPRSSFSTPQQNPKFPTLQPIQTTQSSPTASTTRSTAPPITYPPPSTNFDSPAAQSAGPMHHHFPPSQFPPTYPLSSPLTGGASSSGYSAATSSYSAPSRYPPSSWRDGSEAARLEEKKINRSSLAPYGESVKRHLESFDLEASLNEMADGAGHIAEFSKVYRQRAHENQRIGMTPQSMPRLEEVDDMLKQSERIQMSLQRMRDVVFNHHQASIVEPPRDVYPRTGYHQDHAIVYGNDVKDGFANGDSKSRKRGRAAPPGRCHSCNRAETPEWRRGPDGARTLCNACGLHYAKLTRKMGGKQAMSSSNLRPKSLDHGSPAL